MNLNSSRKPLSSHTTSDDKTPRPLEAESRILVVDDDAEIRNLLIDFLRFKGFSCDSAADGYEALARLAIESYNLLITDINMPGMTGIELVTKVNVLAPDLPKIIFSGEGQFRDALAAIGASVFAYFTKPLRDFEEFDRVVRRALDQESRTRQMRRLEARVRELEAASIDSANVVPTAGYSEEHYRRLLENQPGAYVVVDDSFRITDLNEPFCQYLGKGCQELVGFDIRSESFNPDLRRLILNCDSDSSLGLAASDVEVVSPLGVKRRFEAKVMLQQSPAGKLRVVYLREVTRQHQSILALRTKNEQLLKIIAETGEPMRLSAATLNNFMDHANAFVFITDLDGNIIEWNGFAERLTGISKYEAASQETLARVFTQFGSEVGPILMESVLRDAQSAEGIEAEISTLGGSKRVFSWNINPLHDLGRVSGAMAIGVDVTTPHRLRHQLEGSNIQLEERVNDQSQMIRRQQERFKHIFEGVQSPIFIASENGRLIEVNPAWLKLFGHKSIAELGDRHFLRDFIQGSHKVEEILTALDRKGFVKDRVVQFRRNSGEIGTILLTITIRNDGHTGVKLYEGVMHDITQLRSYEQKLREQNRDLETRIRARSAELAESEAKFRRLTENSPDVIYRIDIAQMRFDYLSPAVEAVTGFKVAKLMKMGPDWFISRIHAKDSIGILELWGRIGDDISEEEREIHNEYRFLRADGEVVWLADHGVIIKSPHGETLAIEGVIHEITAQKLASNQLAEQASFLEQEVGRRTKELSESEHRYRTLLSEAGDVIFTCDQDGNFTEINHRGEDLLGRKLSEINAVGFHRLLDENSRRLYNRAMQSCIKAGVKPDPYQIEYTTPRGTKLFLEIQSSPLIVDDRVVMVLQVARDLTSRRRAAQAIRTLKEFNEGIIRSMSEGIFIENDEGICEFVNPAMAEMLGYKTSELEGRHTLEFVHPEDRDYVSNQTQLRRLRGFARYEARMLAIDGEEVPVHFSSRTRFDNDAMVGSLSVITDLRNAKEMERRQRYMERLLADERKLADIGQLASGIAHNISSPLMIISGYAQLLRVKYPDTKEFDVIVSQIDKITEIARNMTNKSRSEKDKAVKPININDLLRTELKFLEANQNFKTRIEKDFRFDEGVVTISGIYSDFSQAFSNIINNAIDAMFKGSERKLRIQTFQDTSDIIIEFQDTGGGISDENLSKIFNPFFTTKPALNDAKEGEPSGTGLGLSTAQELMSNYGGRIEVESVMGEGTTFRIVIPVGGRQVTPYGTPTQPDGVPDPVNEPSLLTR